MFNNTTSTSTDSFILDETFPKNSQPKDIIIPLKEHQLTLLHACRKLEDSCNNNIIVNTNFSEFKLKTKFGIIGDVVGSGKTLTILSIIADNPIIVNKLPKVSVKSNLVICYENSINSSFQVKPYNIIVVPHTIYKQWLETIQKFTKLKYFGINNTKTLEQFKEIFSNEEQSLNFDASIILISNTRFLEFINLNLTYWNNSQVFSRYFFDEADILKIPNSIHYKINSSFIWFVTSSYKTLLQPYHKRHWKNLETGDISPHYSWENGYTNCVNIGGIKNNGFIKGLMGNIISFPSEYKKYLVLRNKETFIRDSFKLMDYKLRIIKCDMPHYLKILDQNVSQTILAHINAGDLKGAIEKLDCKKYSENDLIKGITEDLETKKDNLEIEFEMKSKMTFSSPSAKKESLTKIKIKIININKKIKSIKDKLNDSKMCCICYDNINNVSITPCCNTKFCFECISKWLTINKACPFCRAKLNFNSLIVVSEEVKKEKKKLLDKLENLKIILENNFKKPNFKMLIFSEFVNSFDKIKELLNSFNLKYSYVSGTTATINKTIRLYKDNVSKDKIDILFLNANYCANGLNLENSTDIVLYHYMNKDTTTQIIGRGQRPGRKEQLNVWKLCYENEIN